MAVRRRFVVMVLRCVVVAMLATAALPSAALEQVSPRPVAAAVAVERERAVPNARARQQRSSLATVHVGGPDRHALRRSTPLRSHSDVSDRCAPRRVHLELCRFLC